MFLFILKKIALKSSTIFEKLKLSEESLQSGADLGYPEGGD